MRLCAPLAGWACALIATPDGFLVAPIGHSLAFNANDIFFINLLKRCSEAVAKYQNQLSQRATT
jgi:hypothetical protein